MDFCTAALVRSHSGKWGALWNAKKPHLLPPWTQWMMILLFCCLEEEVRGESRVHHLDGDRHAAEGVQPGRDLPAPAPGRGAGGLAVRQAAAAGDLR